MTPLQSRVYPRVCGGNIDGEAQQMAREGLSPRVRGKHWYLCIKSFISRSIPACAGETSIDYGINIAEAVYPRVCGGNGRRPVLCLHQGGLSPRVRGKHKIGFPDLDKSL